MAIIKCKMCGGDIELAPDKTFGTCEYCGSTMTLPKVSDDQRAAAFNRGNHFRRSGEFDKALAVYERIVAEDDTDAEAHWCCALCRFGIEYVEDPATYEYLPTCHRASFDSFLKDVDYLAAVEHSDGITRRQYQKDAAKIADVQRGILATSQNEEPFDIFICYKESDENGNRTVDSTLAQDIYYQFTEQGRRVFFARITLEDKAGTEYEPYIFAALNSAKVMIALGTKPEHFNAVWVKNEWGRFLGMMKKDHSKLLLPCYRDMDPYDLPEALSVLQSYDMSKIGFIQDLIRGVNKVLKTNQNDNHQPEQSSSMNALLSRVFIYVDDENWEKATEYCDKTLSINPNDGYAWLAKMLIEMKCRNKESLSSLQVPLEISEYYQKVISSGNTKLANEVISINEKIKWEKAEEARKEKKAEDEKRELERKETAYNTAKNYLGLGEDSDVQTAVNVLKSIPGWKDSDNLVEQYTPLVLLIEKYDEYSSKYPQTQNNPEKHLILKAIYSLYENTRIGNGRFPKAVFIPTVFGIFLPLILSARFPELSILFVLAGLLVFHSLYFQMVFIKRSAITSAIIAYEKSSDKKAYPDFLEFFPEAKNYGNLTTDFLLRHQNNQSAEEREWEKDCAAINKKIQQEINERRQKLNDRMDAKNRRFNELTDDINKKYDKLSDDLNDEIKELDRKSAKLGFLQINAKLEIKERIEQLKVEIAALPQKREYEIKVKEKEREKELKYIEDDIAKLENMVRAEYPLPAKPKNVSGLHARYAAMELYNTYLGEERRKIKQFDPSYIRWLRRKNKEYMKKAK